MIGVISLGQGGLRCLMLMYKHKEQEPSSREEMLEDDSVRSLCWTCATPERSLKIFIPSRLALLYLALQKQRCILQKELLVQKYFEVFQDWFLWNLFSECISCLPCHWESPYWWNTTCATSIQEDIAGSTQINLKTFFFLHEWYKFYGLSFHHF